MEKAERALDRTEWLAIRNGQLQLKALVAIIWDENSSKIPMLFFQSQQKHSNTTLLLIKVKRKQKHCGGTIHCSIDAEDWKKAAAFGPIARVLSPEEKNPKEIGYGHGGRTPRTKTRRIKNAQSCPEKKKSNLRSTRTRTKPHYLKTHTSNKTTLYELTNNSAAFSYQCSIR